jgi:hypothetical protein
MATTPAERSRRYRESHPERIREIRKQWYARNREKELARIRDSRTPEDRKHANWWAKYRLRPTQVIAMLDEQAGRCAICGRDISDFSFVVDHDHTTGAVRGLLCRRCNTVVGFVESPPEVWQPHRDYVEAHRK